MIYQFKKGITFRGVDAQTAGDSLESIRVRNSGKLKPEDVVASAASPRSPLHNAFTWDDDKAAHAFRLSEARQLIRAVIVVPKKGLPQAAFWNVVVTRRPNPSDDQPTSNERYYQSARVIAGSPIEYEAALRVMLSELSSAQDGLQRLRTLAPHGQRMKVTRATKLVETAADSLR